MVVGIKHIDSFEKVDETSNLGGFECNTPSRKSCSSESGGRRKHATHGLYYEAAKKELIRVGAWRSLVAYLNGVQRAGGSNPLAPTN